MAVESVQRLLEPRDIAFDQALWVAALGLVVDLASALLPWQGGHHHSDRHHGGHDAHHEDHNLRAAYLHGLADALTSVLAIAALLAGKFAGWTWLDPSMGLVGAALILRWARGLAHEPLPARLLEALADLAHVVIEVNRCEDPRCSKEQARWSP